jgi:ribonuclease T2
MHVLAILLLCLATLADARSRRATVENSRPGNFDYYLLSLSWSPEYCRDPQHLNRDPGQCAEGRRFAFVTHGLWPNNNRPPHPNRCAPKSPLAADLKNQMLQFMPSPALIQHEWDVHGTCSGLNQQDYFSRIRAAFRKIIIPEVYRQPEQDLRIPADQIRRDFLKANAAIPAASMKLDCGGQYLREVRICLDKDLNARACPAAIQDSCGSRSVTLLKVR